MMEKTLETGGDSRDHSRLRDYSGDLRDYWRLQRLRLVETLEDSKTLEASGDTRVYI